MRGQICQRRSRTFAKTTLTLLVTITFLALPATAEVLLTGAGATFPSPLYNKWFTQYATVDDRVRFDY